MQMGKEGHDSITALAKPVSTEMAIKDAVAKREKPVCIYEFGVAWKYKDTPIIGFIDEAWFRGGDVDLVVERKFSDSLRVYSGYHIQAQLYCLGLGEMGFNNSSAEYKIMVFKRKCYECPKLAENVCPILVPELEVDSYQCENGRVHGYLYPFNRGKIIKDLDWALDFWTKKRETIPTKNAVKCRSCRHKEICESSLV